MTPNVYFVERETIMRRIPFFFHQVAIVVAPALAPVWFCSPGCAAAEPVRLSATTRFI
jgi:hypothetical protein